MFTKREFKRGDLIMVDKVIMTEATDTVSACAKWAIDQLTPLGGTMADKWAKNAWTTGMFVTGSRINHECIGNCDMGQLLGSAEGTWCYHAVRDILAGEEVTIAYLPISLTPQTLEWGFRCLCRVCTDDEITPLVAELIRLYTQTYRYWDNPSGGAADSIYLEKSHRIIELYDLLQIAPERYMFTYYDMFQFCVRNPQTLDEGLGYLKLAYESMLLMFGGKVIGRGLLGLQKFINDPTKHRLYLIDEPERTNRSRRSILDLVIEINLRS